MEYKNMTEHKRVPLTTVVPTKIEKKREKKAKCLRISLRLPESNEKSCPEFNYRELVAHSLSVRFKKKQDGKSGNKPLGNVINTPMLDPTDPFARDEDEALKIMAEQLEKKYGGYGAPKKKKRKKENDFSTMGEGYDDTDPFIDNSDAIDEVIATNVETRHRGFYINSGELELEEVAELEEGEASDGDGEIVKKKKKANRIDSDSDDSEDEELSKKRKNSSENGIDKHKKRKLDEGEMLRKRKKMIDRMNAQKEHPERKDHSDGEKVANGSDSKGASEKSIAASIESVIAKVREGGELKRSEDDDSNSSTGSTSSSSDSDSSNSSSSKDSDSEDENDDEERGGDGEDSQDKLNLSAVENGHLHPENGQDAPLPENLPPELILVISRLKEEGRRSNVSSQKFFTDTVNKILISIEMKLFKIGGRKRTQIYNHMAQHVPCGAQTLMKRAKNLLAEKNDNKLREPIKKLQDAVVKSMPAMLETYNQECKKALENNSLENGIVNKDEEGSQDGDKKKVSRLPKKKYTFTTEIRQMLNNVVQVRVSAWQIMKKRSESPEEHIKAFLDAEVRTLWPKGWVNARILFKESINAHACLTDKMHAKAIAAKKLSVLGGSPVTAVPRKEVNSPKPSITANSPMPSTTATVNSLTPASTQPSMGTTLFKPIINTTQTIPKSSLLVAPKPQVQMSVSNISEPKLDNIPKKVSLSNDNIDRISNSGLSIRSVEKINDVPSKSNTQAISMPLNLSEKVHSNLSEKIKNKRPSSDVIDLSSDDERSHNKSKSATSVIKSVDKDSKSNTAKALSSKNGNHPIKDDNLDEEMDSVMNEILNISKNYSPDRSSVSNTKESSNTVIVTSSIKSNQNQTQLPQNPSQLPAHQSQSPVIIKTTQNSISSTNQHSLPHQISTMPKPASSTNQKTVSLPKFVSANQQPLNKISVVPKQGVISVAPWSKMENNKNPKSTGTNSSNITWTTSPVQDQSGKGSKPAELLPIGKSTAISTTSNSSSSSSGMLGSNRASISIVKSTNAGSSAVLNYKSSGTQSQPANPTLLKDAAGNQTQKQKVTSQNVSSVHSGMTQEQIQQYKKQLQQQQKQQELWQQLSNMGQMSNSEMYTLMAQMGYQQSQTGTGQNPGKL